MHMNAYVNFSEAGLVHRSVHTISAQHSANQIRKMHDKFTRRGPIWTNDQVTP